MILKLLVESFGTKDAAKGFSEVLSEAAISMADLGKTGASSSKQISKFFSVLKSGFSKSLVAKISVASAGTVAAIGTIVAICYRLSKVSDEVQEKARELGEEFKREKTEIENYKERLQEFHDTLNDESSSIEEVTEARKGLITVQSELIDKYGNEKEKIDAITEAINGQSDALDRLTQLEYQRKLNKFNEDISGWNKFSNSVMGYEKNTDRMEAEMGYQTRGVESGKQSKLSLELQKELKAMGYTIVNSIYGNGNTLMLSGTLEQIEKDILKIQDLENKFDKNKSDKKFFDNLRKEATDVGEILDNYSDSWDEYLLNTKISKDENLENIYDNVVSAKKLVDAAFTEGTEEEISLAKNEFAKVINEAISLTDDENIIEFFRNMYSELQAEVATWNFKVKFEADIEGDTSSSTPNPLKFIPEQNTKQTTQDNVRNNLAAFIHDDGRAYSAEELKALTPNSVNGAMETAYNALSQIANENQLDWDDFIDVLVELKEVQTGNYQQLVEVLGEDQLSGLHEKDIALLESADGAASMYKKMLADEHVQDELRKENEAIIKSLNEDISRAEDFGYEIGVDITEDSPILLQDIADKQELIRQKADEAGISVEEWMKAYSPDTPRIIADASTRAINKLLLILKDVNSEMAKLSFKETEENIYSLSEGLDVLSHIYGDVLNKGSFDYSVLFGGSDEEKTEFEKIFGNMTNVTLEYQRAYDEFLKTVSNSPTDINACQMAFNKLATALINNSNALSTLDEETKKVTIDQLQQMGVADAEAKVTELLAIKTEALTLEKQYAARITDLFANRTSGEISALFGEMDASDAAKAKLAQYTLQKILANGTTIKTEDDIRNLIAIANAAGASAASLADFNLALKAVGEYSGKNPYDEYYEHSEYWEWEYNRAESLKELEKIQSGTYQAEFELLDAEQFIFSGSKDIIDDYNDSKSGAKDATDALKEAIQQEIDALEKQKEALQDSLNELDELYDAIQWFLDGKIEDIDDIIEKIQEENDTLAEQREIYDNILSVVDSVYNAEIEAIQEKIDALSEENDEKEKAIALEKARQKVEEMRNNKSILQYTADKGYIYTVDEAGLKEAEDEYADLAQELEESKIKKELEDQIELLEKYRDMWGEIPEAFEKSMNELEAMKHFGTDWKNAILNSDEGTIGEFQGNYTGLQENEKANEDKISYYEEEKKKIEDLKELWEDAKNAYRDSQYEAKLASFFGSDYEHQILNNSLTWRTQFTNEYCSLQMQIADIEEKIKSLNEQSANIVADSANKVSTALNQTTDAVNGLKESIKTDGTNGSNILSGVESSVDKTLIQIESLRTALSNLDVERRKIEETINLGFADTAQLASDAQLKVQEIETAISSLLLSIILLRINIEELLNTLLIINDTVTLDRVITLIGSGEEGSLLGAINSVINKLSGENEGLLYELNQLNEKQLNLIIAEFNGDESLLSAIRDVSSAILSDGDECLISKINKITETIGNIDAVKNSFNLLESQIDNCVIKVDTLNEKIQSLQDKTVTITVDTVVNGASGVTDVFGNSYSNFTYGRATGGIIGKEDENDLDHFARAAGEDHMVALTEGEAVIPVDTVKSNPELVNNLLNANGKSIGLSSGISYKVAGESFNKNGNTFTPVNVPNLFGSTISGFNLDKVAPKYENKMNPESYINTVSNDNSVSIVIGDINLSGVQDVNGLSDQIMSRLPNLLVQGVSKLQI